MIKEKEIDGVVVDKYFDAETAWMCGTGCFGGNPLEEEWE
jgi:hypothetical protein